MARREGGRLRGVLHDGRTRLEDAMTAWRMRRRLAAWVGSSSPPPPLEPLPSFGLTVVVPCFNHESFLPYAVESLAAQTLERFDVVLVDDRSTDGTAGLLRGLAETLSGKGEVSVVRHDRNVGQAATLNEAIGMASTPLVAVLNDDDYLTTGALEATVGAFRSDPGLALVGTHSRWFDGDGPAPSDPVADGRTVDRFAPAEFRRLRKPADLNLTHSGMTVRRDVVGLVGGYRSDRGSRLVPFSDRDLQLRVAGLYPVAVLREPLVWWRSDSSVDAGLHS